MSESSESNISQAGDKGEVLVEATPASSELSGKSSDLLPEKPDKVDESKLTSEEEASSSLGGQELGSDDVPSPFEPTNSDKDSLILACVESPEKKEVLGESTDEDLLLSPPRVKARPKHAPILPPTDSPKKTKTRRYSPVRPPTGSPDRRELRGNRRSIRLSDSKGSEAEANPSLESEKMKAITPKKGTIISLRKDPQDNEEPERKMSITRHSIEEFKMEFKENKQSKNEGEKPMQGQKRKATKEKCDEGKPQPSKGPEDNPPKKKKYTPIVWP